jgi:hypothetical protein
VNRKRLLKLAFTVLSIATVVWGIVFSYTLQEYRKYVEVWNQSESNEWGLPKTFQAWNGGVYVTITGELLLCAWAILIGGYLLRKDENENV